MIPLLLSLALASAPDSASPTHSVGGVISHYNPKYPIYLALFSSDNDFKSHRPYKRLGFPAKKLPADSLHYEFTGVAPGEYIVCAFQDIDGDRDIKVGIFGPGEPFRMYRPYRGMFAPKFNVCKFRVAGDVRNADIRF